jgi:hypothetical protein
LCRGDWHSGADRQTRPETFVAGSMKLIPRIDSLSVNLLTGPGGLRIIKDEDILAAS